MPAPATAFADVAVQLPVAGTYCYEIPARLRGRVTRGARVMVPFGHRGVAGVVVGLLDTIPAGLDTARPLDALLADEDPIPADLLELCLWISSYYEAPPGEALRAALPVGAQVSAQKIVELTPAGEQALSAGGALSRRDRDVLGVLAQAGGAAPQRALVKPGKAPRGTSGPRGVRARDIAELVEAGLLRYRREMDQARVKARTERTAVIARAITDDDRAGLARAPKQLAALTALERAGGAASVAALRQHEPNIAAHLRALARAELIHFEQRPRALTGLITGSGADNGGNGDMNGVHAPSAPPVLSEAQAQALTAIQALLADERFGAALLYGITGSGKTEVYLHAIADVLAAGKSAIVLVPEISLTPQLAARFRARFGDQVAILHSALSNRQRVDEWQRLRTGAARIALGARSAVFAPVANLGIIVVDEEHDSSFKQEEGVRYHGRDVALVRAQRAGAVCLLGSATPSLESYFAAESGRYKLLALPERPTPKPLPEIRLIDLRVHQPERDAMLTAPLAQAIEETLARDEQVILFLNRRGFDTFVLCVACGQPLHCHQCSVSLTYHRGRDLLICHYCGSQRRVPDRCPSCFATGRIVRRGLGTEKVAAAVAERFASARVDRLDRDVASGPQIGPILGRMARRETDILVGTQMVTKGHDFPGVTLVGVLCADTGLSLPDFRASERTFQLLTQVAGRAGRGDRAGQVLIQSYRPDSVAVSAAAKHDYAGFYRAERAARQETEFPPYGYLAAVRIDGRYIDQVIDTANALAAHIRPHAQALSVDIMGPSEAPLAKLKGRTRWHMWLRAKERKPLRQLLRLTQRGPDDAHFQPPADVRVSLDVDPVSAL